MFNIQDLMGQMQEMQASMQQARANLDNVIAEAEVGGGAVTAKANANRKLLAITINPTLLDKNDVEMLEDLVVTAVNRAMELAEKQGAQEMEKLTQGLFPGGLPDLGNTSLI
jgi:DNA-binding YbaB/EbfC family protein